MRYFIPTALVLLVVAIFLGGCNGDDAEPAGAKTILTLQVDDGAAGNDSWIYASDENGEVLDLKHYGQGETIVLTSEKKLDKIDVTFFNYGFVKLQFITNPVPVFNTWTDIPTGTTLHLVAPQAPGVQSEATIKISGYTAQYYGPMPLPSNGYPVTTTSSWESWADNFGDLDLNVTFRGAPSDILMSAYRSNVPVYNWVRGVNAGDVIERDFGTDFQPFPHPFTLDFPGRNSAIIKGIDSKGAAITLLDTDKIVPAFSVYHPVIGYLDGFTTYDLTVDNYNEVETIYHKRGAIDYSFKMPDASLSVADNTLLNYSFDFSGEYTYYDIAWLYQILGGEYSAFIHWNVHEPAGRPVKGMVIPDSITSKYSMNILEHKDIINYGYITIHQIKKGKTYLESVPGMPYAEIAEQEEYTISR